MDALPHRIMLKFIVGDMLLESFRGREDFLWCPLINNKPQILIWCYHNCLINSSSLASPNTAGLSKQPGALWEGEDGNKILYFSLAGPWGAQVGRTVLPPYPFSAPFSIKLTLRSKLCPVQSTAKNNRTVTHHKQTNKADLTRIFSFQVNSVH